MKITLFSKQDLDKFIGHFQAEKHTDHQFNTYFESPHTRERRIAVRVRQVGAGF